MGASGYACNDSEPGTVRGANGGRKQVRTTAGCDPERAPVVSRAMRATRTSVDHLLPLVLVLVIGTGLWYLHAIAWDLGGRSPILSYDSAQYALAARELSWHGRLATPFALPADLAKH